ncbi:hypothetical protein BKA70DRAFT_352078 [Coprinopsis sp. MPI-PUGE-AT-0042]|nr:hypothetical protein BKA70DRAFT_352078 [Coprinopsis sp. MPI-PUGE-AT-0042]
MPRRTTFGWRWRMLRGCVMRTYKRRAKGQNGENRRNRPLRRHTRDRGQHDELCTLSENKIVQKGQAILELKNQTPACYQYVDGTDGRDCTIRGRFERMTVFAAANSSVCRWNDGSQHTTKLPRSSGVTIDLLSVSSITFTHEGLPSCCLARRFCKVATGTFFSLSGVVTRDIPVLRQQHSGHDTLLLPIVFPGRFLSSSNSCVWDSDGFLHFCTVVSQMQIASSWTSTTTKALLNLTSRAHAQMLAYRRKHVYTIVAVV